MVRRSIADIFNLRQNIHLGTKCQGKYTIDVIHVVYRGYRLT